jgi:hypothetical protein
MTDAFAEWIYIPTCNEFFGEVKFRSTPSGDYEVAVIVMPSEQFGLKERVRTALALDGSKSMLQSYGAHLPAMLRKKRNTVQPVAQDIALHLASKGDGTTALAYWSCGADGGDFEPIGILSANDINSYSFLGPQDWGIRTKLTPIIRYFWGSVFADAQTDGVAVILTDGAWEDDDHRQLLALTQEMCNQVASGQRRLMKCVLLGWTNESNENEIQRIESRFNDLDNFDSGTEIDVWSHKWINDMRDFNQIFIELVRETSLQVGGRILDGARRSVLAKDEFNFGIDFTLPGNSREFTLVLDEVGEYTQAIR